MTQPQDVMGAAFTVYTSLIAQPRPRFVDEGQGSTRIHIAGLDFYLRTQKQGFSITSPEGDRLEYVYSDDDVVISMTPMNLKPALVVRWKFDDPAKYLLKLETPNWNGEQ